MNEIQTALKELHKTIGCANQHAGAYAISIGEKEHRQHACQGDGTTLRHFIQRDKGKHRRKCNAQSAIGQHTRRPALLVLGNGKHHDADQQQRDNDAPSSRGNLGKFRKHDGNPLL